MRSAHRSIVVAGLIAFVACGASKKELKRAKASVYDTDFAIVYNGALEATRELYPTLNDSPGPGMIKTAWHQVAFANNQDDLSNQRTIAAGQGYTPGQGVSPGQSAIGTPTRLAYKRFFVRFDVSVVGRRPWRVKVVGHASEWEPGNAMPTELTGAARPSWLDGRTDALTVAIYKKIKPYAIPMKEEVEVKPEEELPKTDPKRFKDVPPTAAVALAKLRDALVRRDHPALRAMLADDVMWNLGGAPGAETAMAMWQADGESLEAMQRVLGAGCAGSDQKVTCPPQGEAAEPVPGTYTLVLELRGEDWKVTSFLKAE